MTAMIATEAARGRPSCFSRASVGASKRFMRLVTAAKTTATKKMIMNSEPMGMVWKTPGRVMNISGGPLEMSSPKEKTAGTTTKAATRAARVSKRATRRAELTTSTSFLR